MLCDFALQNPIVLNTFKTVSKIAQGDISLFRAALGILWPTSKLNNDISPLFYGSTHSPSFPCLFPKQVNLVSKIVQGDISLFRAALGVLWPTSKLNNDISPLFYGSYNFFTLQAPFLFLKPLYSAQGIEVLLLLQVLHPNLNYQGLLL